MNLTPIADSQAFEISENLTEDQKKEKTKEMTMRSSIYMNPSIITKLLSRMTQKDTITR
jgi:hypothetical protein